MDLKVRCFLILIFASHKVSSEDNEFFSSTKQFFEKMTISRLSKLENQVQEIWEYINGTKVVNVPKNNVHKNCKEVLDHGINLSGVYSIQPKDTSEAFLVFCDMELQGGGWTYFLDRFDGSVDFYVDWEDYKEGFGNVNGEFWLGLQHLHELTDSENELLVELIDWNNTKVYAHYSSFAIGSEEEGFLLKVIEGYSGDAGDALSGHRGMKFSTRDKDQDGDPDGSCAISFDGAWWYENCMYAQLTGKYMRGTLEIDQKGKSMYWESFHGSQYGLKEARMMVKPKSNNNLKLI